MWIAERVKSVNQIRTCTMETLFLTDRLRKIKIKSISLSQCLKTFVWFSKRLGRNLSLKPSALVNEIHTLGNTPAVGQKST